MKTLAKVFFWLGAFGLTAGIFGLLAVMLVFSHFSKGLPTFEKLAQYEPPVITRLYAANGKLLAEYATEKRIFTPLKAIPEKVRNAFIAAEDKNFYQHQGVDVFGIARAIRENIQNYGSGRSMVGGSTITQQVVKNFLLTNEKSFERKIKEAILAYRISKVYSKDKILELYLNEIYLGNGSYGVAAAALNYFNKPLNELSTEEAALLAAMPKAPSNYDPRFNPQRALERRNYVIGRMFGDNYLTEFEAQRARTMPIELSKRDRDEIVRADFFAEEVRRELADLYGSQVLYEGGLTVKTTVDQRLQNLADKVLRATLRAYDRRYGYRGPINQIANTDNWKSRIESIIGNTDVALDFDEELALVLKVESTLATIGLKDGQTGAIPLSELKWARKDVEGRRLGAPIASALQVLSPGDLIIVARIDESQEFALRQVPELDGALVAMEPDTGKVLAMSGGYSYQNTEFNRATQAMRQPGSAFKPFVYMAALENGFTPSTIIVDEPIAISQGPGKPLWRPKNYGGKFLGPVTLRTGLEKSRNTMTVRLAQMLGIGRIINVARRMGIYEGDLPNNYSMVLGAKETTLLKMVNAYAMVANGGRKVRAALIERIDDRHGDIIYRRDDRPCPECNVPPGRFDNAISPPELVDARPIVIDPRIAYQLTSILEGVAIRGTAASAYKALQRPVAGKTGTTNDSRDAWFIGYSPDLVVGVYVGYDNPKSLGPKETGGRVALPGFIDYMQAALMDVPKRPFRTPPGIRILQVDASTGLPPHPGMIGSGKMIEEIFVVGSPIYRPPLPEDAEDERQLAQDYEMMQEMQGGFDPHADWEDAHYYMSPERAARQDEQYRRYQGERNRLGTIYPGNARYYNPQPQNQAPPAREQTYEGFDVNAGARTTQPPSYAPPPSVPVAPEADNVYRRRTPAQRDGGDVGMGTGGLY